MLRVFIYMVFSLVNNVTDAKSSFFPNVFLFVLYILHFRHCSLRLNRKVLCLPNPSSCGESGQDRTSPTIGKKCTRYSDPTLRVGNVHSSSIQHLPSTFPCHVYFCHIWHEFLHEREAPRNLGCSFQFWNFRTIHDSTLPDVNQCRYDTCVCVRKYRIAD